MLVTELNRLMGVPYRAHGRDWSGVDCWGLVTLYRRVLGLRPLPSHEDVAPVDTHELNQRAIEVAANLDRVEEPEAGDIFAGYSCGTMVHIGVAVHVDGRLWVLHTREATGPRLDRLDVMRRCFTSIAWFRHAED